MSDEEEMIEENDEEEEEEYNNQTVEPVVDVLQIDNELSSTQYRFKKNEVMLCYHGLLLYEVKCVDHKMKENDSGNFHRPSYLVHYCGWSSKWDEWVDEARLVKLDENGLKQQAQLLLQYGKGKARLKNLRKNNPNTSPLKRTTSRSISDYSTNTNNDSVTNESTTNPTTTSTNNNNTNSNNNNNNNSHSPIEEAPSLSGGSDAGSSSSSTTSELISNTDSIMMNNDLTEPDTKRFKRTVNATVKITTKDKSKIRFVEFEIVKISNESVLL